jgi:hypothetical protein
LTGVLAASNLVLIHLFFFFFFFFFPFNGVVSETMRDLKLQTSWQTS